MNRISTKFFLFLGALAVLAACDSDFNEIGANMVGNDNFGFGTAEDVDVLAYTQPTGPVETTNLRVDASNGVNQLGIYDNPVFGKSTAHVVVEAKLSVANPVDFTLRPRIESATLTIPYFNTATADATSGTTVYTYELDSIYGPANGKLDLGIYESTYYIRTNHDTGAALPYYNNAMADFTKGAKLNTASDVKQNTAFEFSNLGTSEVDESDSDNDGDVTETIQIAPRMKIALDTTALGPKFFGAAANGNLLNNNLFTNYFRGLHFTVGQSGSDPARMALMNFAGGKIVVKYKQHVSSDAGAAWESELQTMEISLSGNSVNLIEYEPSATYNNVLSQTPNTTQGDDLLYLKGGQGSMAVIELFNTTEKLAELRSHKDEWLINDASLTFYVENNMMNATGTDGSKAYEPNRLYIYDLNNNVPLADYSSDALTSYASVKYNKGLHGGIIKLGSDGRGSYYKIRITNHVRNLMRDATKKNVRLGLVVTENINVTSNKKIQTPIVLPENSIFGTGKKIEEVPIMNVANPFGTVLYGSNRPVSDPKRLKLTIYYTKPN